MGFYETYLQSNKWQEKRQERLKIDGFRCRLCHVIVNTPENPAHIHHSTYERLGNENVKTDLITLCEACHDVVTTALRQRKYNNRELPIITVEEITNQRRQNHVDRETIHIDWHMPANSSQRADCRPAKQILQIAVEQTIGGKTFRTRFDDLIDGDLDVIALETEYARPNSFVVGQLLVKPSESGIQIYIGLIFPEDWDESDNVTEIGVTLYRLYYSGRYTIWHFNCSEPEYINNLEPGKKYPWTKIREIFEKQFRIDEEIDD